MDFETLKTRIIMSGGATCSICCATACNRISCPWCFDFALVWPHGSKKVKYGLYPDSDLKCKHKKHTTLQMREFKKLKRNIASAIAGISTADSSYRLKSNLEQPTDLESMTRKQIKDLIQRWRQYIINSTHSTTNIKSFKL